MLAVLAQARWIVPIVALSLITSGCTSFTRIEPQSPTAAAAVSNLKPGDTVRVVLRNRTRHTFTVAAISDVAITSSDGQFPATDIVALERRDYDVKKNVGLVLIGVAVIFIIGIAHAYGELLGGWS